MAALSLDRLLLFLDLYKGLTSLCTGSLPIAENLVAVFDADICRARILPNLPSGQVHYILLTSVCLAVPTLLRDDARPRSPVAELRCMPCGAGPVLLP